MRREGWPSQVETYLVLTLWCCLSREGWPSLLEAYLVVMLECCLRRANLAR